MNTISNLQGQLDLRANPKTKAWWEGYLKHVIPFRGVKMADIRAVLHQWVKEEGIETRFGNALAELLGDPAWHALMPYSRSG